MCDAGTILSAMTSIVAADEQQQQAQRNEASANAAYLNDVRQLNLRQREEQEAESQRGMEADIQSMKDVSTARTASGESGVSGLSVDALMTDIFDDTKADSNLSSTEAQIAQQKKGAESGRQSRINSVPYPSFAATALQIGGSAYEGGYFKGTDPYKARIAKL